MTYIVGEDLPPALYDLSSDPGEQVDLAGRGLAVEAELRRRARGVLATGRSAEGGRRRVDAETLDELEMLGYVR
jgi:hypothetical protein